MNNQYIQPVGELSFRNIKPNYNICFHQGGQEIGRLDFNGPEMVFTGDTQESAKLFFDWIAKSFAGRLEDERKAEREACAKVCEEYETNNDITATWLNIVADAIRARGEASIRSNT
jgi:hypothetical protein